MVRPPAVILSAIAILMSFGFRQHFYQESFRFTVQGIALFPIIGCLIFSTHFRVVNQLLNSAPAIWIGQLSYSLYVWHLAALFLFSDFATTYLPISAFSWFMFSCSFVVASVSYYFFEKPLLKYRTFLRRNASETTLKGVCVDFKNGTRLGGETTAT